MSPPLPQRSQDQAPPVYSSRGRLLKSSHNSPSTPSEAIKCGNSTKPRISRAASHPCTPTTIPTTSKFQRWKPSEDKVFARSIARWGTQWDKIQADLARVGAPVRGTEALRQRYHALQSMADRQRELASQGRSASSASSSAGTRPQQQSTAAALIAASKLLHSAKGSAAGAWTQKELRTLTNIWRSLGEECGIEAVWQAWCKAIPRRTRSRRSVEVRLSLLRKEQRAKRRRRRHAGRDEEEDYSSGSGEEDGSGSGAGDESEDDGDEADRSKASRSSTRAEASQRTRTAKQLPGPAAALRPREAECQGSRQAPAQSGFTNTQPIRPTSRLDVAIDRMPNGFKIFGLPPGYGVLITSPLDCQVVSPAWWSEHEQEAATSPFAFKRLHDGSIEGVSYPLGTRANMSLIKASEGGGMVGADVGSDSLVQTVFTSADRFRVLFVNEVS